MGCAHLPLHVWINVSNSAWNTISPCLKRRRKIHRSKIKDKPNVPLKSFHIQHIYSFSGAWQLVMCCFSRRRQPERKACICMNLQKLSYCVNRAYPVVLCWFLEISSYNWDVECILLLTYFDLLDPPPHIVCAQKGSTWWNGKWGGGSLFYKWMLV